MPNRVEYGLMICDTSLTEFTIDFMLLATKILNNIVIAGREPYCVAKLLSLQSVHVIVVQYV